eukprot:2330501-Rhodomonas_salina.1
MDSGREGAGGAAGGEEGAEQSTVRGDHKRKHTQPLFPCAVRSECTWNGGCMCWISQCSKVSPIRRTAPTGGEGGREGEGRKEAFVACVGAACAVLTSLVQVGGAREGGREGARGEEEGAGSQGREGAGGGEGAGGEEEGGGAGGGSG